MKNFNYLSKRTLIFFGFFFFASSYVQMKAANYTWTGNISTSWSLDSNWSPIGVPGINDNVTIVTGSNQVYLNGNISITNFTLTSGTFNLQGYSFTVKGTPTLNGGTVTNGKFFIAGTSTATFNNTHIVSWASITANSIFLTLSTFDDSIKFVKKGTSPNVSKGGNIFNGFVSIIDSSSGPLIFADSLPDTFNSSIQVGGTSTGYVYLAHRAQGNIFNGVVTVNYGAVVFNQYGTANFNNNIVLNCAGSGPSNGVIFGSSTGSSTLAT